MKKLITLLLIISALGLSAQNEGTFRVGFVGQVNNYKAKVFNSYGLNLQYFVTEEISLDYKLTFGYNGDDEFNMHLSAPALGSAYLGSPELLFLAACIPEGISYHFYPTEMFELAPYVAPLGCEINYDSEVPLSMSGEMGLQLYLKPNEYFFISPNYGIGMLYSNGEIVSHYGIALGVTF
jgi:hypothetical protein